MPDKSASALVTEISDFDDRLTARFNASWSSADGRQERGPQEAPLDVALRWARARSDVVFLRLGSDQYSAGRQQPEPAPGEDPLPTWRDGTVVRARPWEAPLDGSRQSAPWRVRVSVVAADHEQAAPVARAIAADVLIGGAVTDHRETEAVGAYDAPTIRQAFREISQKSKALIAEQFPTSGAYVLLGSDE